MVLPDNFVQVFVVDNLRVIEHKCQHEDQREDVVNEHGKVGDLWTPELQLGEVD